MKDITPGVVAVLNEFTIPNELTVPDMTTKGGLTQLSRALPTKTSEVEKPPFTLTKSPLLKLLLPFRLSLNWTVVLPITKLLTPFESVNEPTSPKTLVTARPVTGIPGLMTTG